MKHYAYSCFGSFLVVDPHFVVTDLPERQAVDLDITESFASSPGGYFGNFSLHIGK